jgi:flagellar biosynthesis component FlhA
VLDVIEKEPGADEINSVLSRIVHRDNAEQDILVIDFGIDMLPIVNEHKLLDEIGKLRDELGDRELGYGSRLPPIRVRDNAELSPSQVRFRYYTDYFLDKEYSDAGQAVSDIMSALRKIAGN